MLLTTRLKTATGQLHRAAERHPFVSSMLGGRLSSAQYVRYLQHLLPVYQTLDRLSQEHIAPKLASWSEWDLPRAQAIASDLMHFGHTPAPVDSGATSAYVEQIRASADRYRLGVVAHFYTRYLGDLAGGQMIGRAVASAFDLHDENGVRFYRFAAAQAQHPTMVQIKQELDRLALTATQIDFLEHEAQRSFESSIALFDSI